MSGRPAIWGGCNFHPAMPAAVKSILSFRSVVLLCFPRIALMILERTGGTFKNFPDGSLHFRAFSTKPKMNSRADLLEPFFRRKRVPALAPPRRMELRFSPALKPDLKLLFGGYDFTEVRAGISR
jgi:hypothetical protein